MDYLQLKYDIDNSPSLKSLRSFHSALIFSFLYQQFKHKQRITVSYQELVENLEVVLESLNEQQPGSYPRTAKNYLDDWSKEQHLLRIYHDSKDVLVVELTPDAERTIRWLEELHQRSFVGTESRFRNIFATLSEIVSNSSSDPEQRLAYLRAQQAALQNEIDEILETGVVHRLNETQLRERYLQTNENALRLLSDFASVEENFRTLARNIREAALKPDLQKGNVVSDVLDADEALENSDEGRSFRAFWQFLLSPTQKDEFTRLLSITQQMPELMELRNNSILPSLTRQLLAAGHKIIESNQYLAEQLRRILDENAVAESQRVRELCLRIKQLAFEQIKYTPANKVLIHLETNPLVNLFMDRPLWSLKEESKFEFPHQDIIPSHVYDLSELETLFSQHYIDENQLDIQIAELLDVYESISLQEVLEHFPPTKGIGEVLSYLRIAAERSQHFIDDKEAVLVEVMLVDNQTLVTLRIPSVYYRRSA